MTSKQRVSIMAHRWPAACEAQGWDPGDRTLRLEVVSEALGRKIESFNELDNGADVDLVFAFLGFLADNVGRTVEVHNTEPGYRRRLLWLVRKHGADLGGDPYVAAIARDKFGLTAGLGALEDLSTDELHQLMMTLNARRRAKGRANRNASLTSEETFPDELEFLPAEVVAADCPF